MMKKINIIAFLFFTFCAAAQQLDSGREYHIAAIGFWNVENLYDTLNDKWKNDDDFTPEGANTWTGVRYRAKIDQLATVIGEIATDITPDGLAILGLCEVENKSVVQDLINSPQLKKRNYQLVHIEGPDPRGVDPAFIYDPRFFSVKKVLAYPVQLVTDSAHRTRDILVVSGTFSGEPLTVLVNHWPSRRGGEMQSRPNRNAAARKARAIADSVTSADPLAKVIIMGDLNDDPVDESVKKYIGTYAQLRYASDGLYFNPMETLYKKGIGTLAWKDNWNLFDQILLSKGWIPGAYTTWQYYKARIFNKEYLQTGYGSFRGYPFRTYSGGVYAGGYSDHYPSYILIAREKK